MIFSKKNFLMCTVVALLVLILALFAILPNDKNSTNYIVGEINEEISNEKFDFYESDINDKRASVMAYKSFDADEFANVNFGETSSIRIAYSLEYDYDAEVIYVAMSTFNDKEKLLDVELLDAYPIYYEDGTFDALVSIEENTILLSELQAGVTKDCFVGTLVIGGGIALGKLLAGLLIGAGVIAGGTIIYKTVEVAVKSGWFTYKTKSLTDEKVNSRTKTAIKQKEKKNPDVYYLAELAEGKLCINSSPWSLKTAKTRIINYGNSFWTPLESHALSLVVAASGGFVGPERHYNHKTGSNKGYYDHYHPLYRVINGYEKVHVWFGKPEGGIY